MGNKANSSCLRGLWLQAADIVFPRMFAGVLQVIPQCILCSAKYRNHSGVGFFLGLGNHSRRSRPFVVCATWGLQR